MADVIELQGRWRRMWRDSSRDHMPRDAAWDLCDWLPDLEKKRGGYVWASPDLTPLSPAATSIRGGIYAPYDDGDVLVAIDEDGLVYHITSPTTASLVAGTTFGVRQNPFMHRDMVVIPAETGTTLPRKLTYAAGTLTLAILAGGPPTARYGVAYKDRSILANTAAEPQRAYFSGPGNSEVWNLAAGYWDFSNPITGIATVPNALLFFHPGHTSRLRGSIPPGFGADSDFTSDDPKWAVGCSDARSIAYWGQNVVWASGEGIYVTDGSDYDDLTKLSGMLSYWQETIGRYKGPGASLTVDIVGGIIRDDYFLFLTHLGAFVDGVKLNLTQRAWTRLSNMDFISAWVAQGATDELYAGRLGAARVASLSSIYTPTAANKNDADGDPVLPNIETPFYVDRFYDKTWGGVYTIYSLVDDGDMPQLEVAYVTSSEATVYQTFAHRLPATSGQERARLRFGTNGLAGISAMGLGLRVRQRNASADTRVYSLQAEVHPHEQSGVR